MYKDFIVLKGHPDVFLITLSVIILIDNRDQSHFVKNITMLTVYNISKNIQIYKKLCKLIQNLKDN